MAYNTKRIKTDVDGKPIPQVFNPALDEYEALKGDAGAARHIIYGADGNPIATAGNKLAVRASEVETLLNDIKGKDFATQTTLSQILAKIIAAPSTEAKQDALAALIGEVQASPTENTLLARIKALETKIDAITDGTTPAVTQLSGSYVEIGGVSFAVSGGDTLRGKSTDKPAAADAHAAIPFCYYHAIDTGAIEVTDGTDWVVV